jgi:hypothetical protein
MLSMADALDRIKGRLAEDVPDELIRRLCHEAGHTWRERDLGPVVTAQLFLQQVLHGNVPVGELRRRSKLDFTDSAYCKGTPQRGRAHLSADKCARPLCSPSPLFPWPPLSPRLTERAQPT